MVDVPTLDDTQSHAMRTGKAALAASFGNAVGEGLLGDLGGVIGTTFAGTYMDSTESRAVTSVRMYDFFNGVMRGGGQGQAQQDPGAI